MRRQVVLATVVLLVVTLGGGLAVYSGDIGTALTSGETRDIGAESGPWFNESDAGLEYQTTGTSPGNSDGGVFVADYDNDEWPDVLAIGGDEPVLFENDNGTFHESGVLPPINVTEIKSALFFDYDQDGWQDLLLVTRQDAPVFLENDGGQFAKRDVGLDRLEYGTGAAAADYTGNGCPDLFVVQNGNWVTESPERVSDGDVDGEYVNGNGNVLYRNDCSGFSRAADAGIEGEFWSLATSFVDLTGDGRPDIHVANDFSPDIIYVNQGDGTFERRVLADTNRHGMSSEIADVNGDGKPDIFVTNIALPDADTIGEFKTSLDFNNRGNNLLINRGNGTFVDRAREYGIQEGGWGWSASISDFDNDGQRELVHATKYYLRNHDGDITLQETTPSLWDRADNGTFRSVDAEDLGFEHSNGRGLAVLDANRDGALDVIVANTHGEFRYYENRVTTGNWLQVRVEQDDVSVLGADVSVTTSDGRKSAVQSSEANFFSQSTRTRHFGLGRAEVQRVRVVFPDGTERVFEDVPTNARVVVTRNGTVRVLDTGSERP